MKQKRVRRDSGLAVVCPICNWRAVEGDDGEKVCGGIEWQRMAQHLLEHLNVVRPKVFKKPFTFKDRWQKRKETK